MKLVTIKLREADYGGYNYSYSEAKKVYQAVSDNMANIESVVKIWLKDNPYLKQVEVNNTVIKPTSIENDNYSDLVWNEINANLGKLENENLKIRFWNSVNWSESYVVIEVTNVELV